MKAAEAQLGIKRSDETVGMGGADAVVLWKLHEKGDKKALPLLKKYNAEDIVNLEEIMGFVYSGMKEKCGFGKKK